MMRQTRKRRTWKNRDEFKVCKHYKYSNLPNLGSRLPQQSKHHHGFGYYSHLAGILSNNYHHCHHHHNSVPRSSCRPCHLKRRVAIGSELVAVLSPATPPVWVEEQHRQKVGTSAFPPPKLLEEWIWIKTFEPWVMHVCARTDVTSWSTPAIFQAGASFSASSSCTYTSGGSTSVKVC